MQLDLNAPTKTYRLGLNEYKNKIRICVVYKRPTDLGTHTLKWGDRKRYSINGNQRKAIVHLSDKKDIKIKTVIRHKKGHYIIVKGSTEEDITIIYAPTQEHLNIFSKC